MHRQSVGQGLFEAMLLIACLALLLMGTYGWIAHQDPSRRETPDNSSGTAPSARQGAVREHTPESGAGGAGAAVVLTGSVSGP